MKKSFKFKKDKPLIEFVTTVDGLDEIPECRPQPAKKFLPNWWGQIPADIGQPFPSIKKCPSFPDYFSQGFILPMWCDTTFTHNPVTGSWEWVSGRDKERTPFSQVFNWSTHFDEQFLDFTKPTFRGDSGSLVFKSQSPWRVITPPGYSTLLLPLFFHYDHEFSVMPGIINTDVFHEVNHQMVYHGQGKTITIKRGEPFAHYIPFKRTSYSLATRYSTEKDKKRFYRQDLRMATKSVGSNGYRLLGKPSVVLDKDVE